MNHQAFLDLISGRDQSPGRALLRGGLSVLSIGYRAGVASRNIAFNIGLKRIHRVSIPVVSVGNITTGGTGKTPFVAHLANWFTERGVPTAILSRGYRALDGEANDEKLVLDRLCPNVPHLQNPDRVTSALRAIDDHGAGVLVLDDGFQHRRLGRDLDIVLIDALNPWGYGRLLPRGLLREPVSSLKRADLVAVTRVDQCTAEEKTAIIDRIRTVHPPAEIVEVAYPPVGLVNSSGRTAEFAEVQNGLVGAFCGIGNPTGFQRTLADAGIEIATDSFREFPDHHHYTSEELNALSTAASEQRVSAVLTTQKDLVKIGRDDLDGTPLWAVQIGMRVLSNRDALEQKLKDVAPSA